jgi:hypothetical protein
VGQDFSYLAILLVGAILAFVGLTAFLPVRIYRKVFGWVWPVDSVDSRDIALRRRLVGAVISAIGLTALQAGVKVLSEHLK